MAEWQENLQRAAGAVQGWFDNPDDSGDQPPPQQAVDAGPHMDQPEARATDATEGEWMPGGSGQVPTWVWPVAGIGAALVLVLALRG